MKKVLILLGALTSMIGNAQIVSGGPVDYKSAGVDCQGYLAYDGMTQGKRPGVLIVPDWNSIDDYEIRRANMLAKLGYVALVADIYGKDVRPKTPQESGAMAGKYKNDRKLFRERLNDALELLKRDPKVEITKVAAIGYCFGGTGVLELARMGADLRGVVSFHGGLDAMQGMEAGPITPRVLVCHGAADPMVPEAQVAGFKTEFQNAKLEFISYPGAVHSFTNPNAGNDPLTGSAYQKEADEKSWEAMRKFLTSVFA